MAKLAIIPARGGSKRIHRKNIKSFFGRPIIAYSIEVALQSGLFDEVMVSTDDDEIAEIARQYGANVPFIRSERNSNDFAQTIDVLNEVGAMYKEKFNKIFDYTCCIYPTAPLITKERLIEGLNLLIENSLDTVFPIVSFSYPILRSVEIIDGKTRLVWPEYANTRTQDFNDVYHDAGQWYWYNPKKVKKTIFTNNTSSIILDQLEVQDIDTLSDWLVAEMKYKLMNGPQ